MDIETYLLEMCKALVELVAVKEKTEGIVSRYTPPDLPLTYVYEKELKDEED